MTALHRIPARRSWIALAALLGSGPMAAEAAPPTVLTVRPDKVRQEFQGLGCGAIFYEGHMNSLAKNGKPELQEQLYDLAFKDVPTRYLHLMIRHDGEPENDNDDPDVPAFKDENFAWCEPTLAICAAARKRRPDIQLYATLYTPPAWMKTNHDPSGGGNDKATLLPGMERELAEYCWAWLEYMHRHGQTVEFLSIANEPDWPHTQPSYFLTPQTHAELFAKVVAWFDAAAKRRPDVPRVKFVAPNILSAVSAAEKWLPPLLRKSGKTVDVIGAHDYDRRGDRWGALRKLAGQRPVWMTEWCVNGPDKSPDLIHSAGEFWLAMSEAFNGGANVWMAYDWVYPPREGGEALIHVDWGNSWHPTRIYYGFKQFAAPLTPGMHVVETSLRGPAASGISQPGLKACAFLTADGRRLVVHAAAVQDQPVTLSLDPGPAFRKSPATRWRTSGTEDAAALEPLPAASGRLSDEVPARALMTWQFERLP